MKKKVLALLWAFNNPAWAFILSQELYNGLDLIGQNIDDQDENNFVPETWSLLQYLRKAGFKTTDDFIQIWDAVVQNGEEIETGLLPVKPIASDVSDDDDDYWDEDDEEPSNMHRPIGKRKGVTPADQWADCIKNLSPTFKNYRHQNEEVPVVQSWHERAWNWASSYVSSKKANSTKKDLVNELARMITEKDYNWAIPAIHDMPYIIHQNYNFSPAEFKHFLSSTGIVDNRFPKVWEDLRRLKDNYPLFYEVAEDWAWGSN